MPKRHKKEKIIKRLTNGACVMERVCKKCRKKFVGERNICQPCQNNLRQFEGKFVTAYNRQYYRQRRSKVAILHDQGSLSRDIPFTAERKKALEIQKKRIREQLAMIKRAGYDPDNDSAGMIERAGIL
jgi:hypothetical protein